MSNYMYVNIKIHPPISMAMNCIPYRGCCKNFTDATPTCNYNLNRAVFIWVSKGNWFCITMLHDWLKKCMPFFHPIVHISGALCHLHVIILSFDWFTGFSVSFVIWLEWLLWFWFQNTQLKTTLIHIFHNTSTIHQHCLKYRFIPRNESDIKKAPFSYN